jgi:hypothetical protein
VLDVDSYDYAYDKRRATGFKVALAHSLDVAPINQDGFYVSPGVNFINVLKLTFFKQNQILIYNGSLGL